MPSNSELDKAYVRLLEGMMREEVLSASPEESAAASMPESWREFNSYKLGIHAADLKRILGRFKEIGLIHIWNMSSPPLSTRDGTLLIREDTQENVEDEEQLMVEYTVADTEALKNEIERVQNLRGSSKQLFDDETNWEDITIRFVGDNTVVLMRKGKAGATEADYEGMGFIDHRNGTPNKAWEFLRYLATRDGRLEWENNEVSMTATKRKQALKDGLKAYFGIRGDPFLSYKKEKAYVLRPKLEIADTYNPVDEILEDDTGEED